MLLTYPEGTTHVKYINRFMGFWEFWKFEDEIWCYFDLFSFEWQEAEPCSYDMPTEIINGTVRINE